MYCINCGNKLKETDRFCPECGTENTTSPNIVPISEGTNNTTNSNVVTISDNFQSTQQNTNNNEMSDKDKNNADLLCFLSLICTFGGGIITALIPPLAAVSGLIPLAGLVLMIVARVKYPQSKFAKVLMWLYIVLYILAIVGVFIFVVLLYLACRSCTP